MVWHKSENINLKKIATLIITCAVNGHCCIYCGLFSVCFYVQHDWSLERRMTLAALLPSNDPMPKLLQSSKTRNSPIVVRSCSVH